MKTPSTTSLLRIIAFSASLLWAGAAAAQGSATAGSDNDGWVPIKHLEFSPDDIEGGTSGPQGEPIIGVPRAQPPSLIEIRAGFEAEIVKTLETL
jgi:hypothetical protein